MKTVHNSKQVISAERLSEQRGKKTVIYSNIISNSKAFALPCVIFLSVRQARKQYAEGVPKWQGLTNDHVALQPNESKNHTDALRVIEAQENAKSVATRRDCNTTWSCANLRKDWLEAG